MTFKINASAGVSIGGGRGQGARGVALHDPEQDLLGFLLHRVIRTVLVLVWINRMSRSRGADLPISEIPSYSSNNPTVCRVRPAVPPALAKR